MLFFIVTHLKVLLRLFDKKLVLEEKLEISDPAHKMVVKFGKSWVVLVYLSQFYHIIE